MVKCRRPIYEIISQVLIVLILTEQKTGLFVGGMSCLAKQAWLTPYSASLVSNFDQKERLYLAVAGPFLLTTRTASHQYTRYSVYPRKGKSRLGVILGLTRRD